MENRIGNNFCNYNHTMKIKKIVILFSLFIFCGYQAQETDSLSQKPINPDAQNPPIYFSSDSVLKHEATRVQVFEDSISADLKLVRIYGLPKFNNDLDRQQYNWLKVRVYRLYPYLTLAVKQYQNLQDSMRITKDDAEFKKYIRKRQKQLTEEYENKLKNLTKTEGKIFSKLMYRSTGKTVYEIIKELKSGWSAFWWNTKAGAFDIDLQEPYDPYHIRDDAFVEAILLRAYQFGDLEPLKKEDY